MPIRRLLTNHFQTSTGQYQKSSPSEDEASQCHDRTPTLLRNRRLSMLDQRIKTIMLKSVTPGLASPLLPAPAGWLHLRCDSPRFQNTCSANKLFALSMAAKKYYASCSYIMIFQESTGRSASLNDQSNFSSASGSSVGSWYGERYSCKSADLALTRVLGSKTSMFSRRSIAIIVNYISTRCGSSPYRVGRHS